MANNDFVKMIALDQRRVTKALNTLMGILSGIVCDNKLENTEIHFLNAWLKEQEDISNLYPVNIIRRKVHEVLSDGVITEEERSRLLKDLQVLSGTDFANTGFALPEHIASIFDEDPFIIFEENYFVFTGDFLFGTRRACEQAVIKRGGIFSETITKKTNYLVVGSMASRDWIVANFGRKLQKAAEMAISGDYEISIVRETDWVMALGD